ncbi:protein kinase [Labrenzia sp. CE80]|uniref:protein kinase domain-containing protein n=1 Tax=Labrenzia sp. CE80 TaxID=1788986 RepID=UPI00129A9E8D|nr:protein kinase [Labrenzia sp. CE80]
MDSVKAKELEAILKGKTLQGFEIIELIDHGKSAAVFKGRSIETDETVAVKVFDDELIAKYGDTAQLKRIKRELELVGKSHQNMVEILGGGFDQHTKNHYLIMGFLDGPNLKKCLQEVPVKNIPLLVSQLANCCEYLEGRGLVHRDIKPENIVLVDDLSKLILLDFGVVRPFGQGDVTDGDGVQSFVGTLQYSSPEFLLRNEKDTREGWRALTFYQIGAVMHDLIMRKPIFEESTQPYARLVNSVQQDTPTISNKSLPNYLIETASLCLSKVPEVRVKTLSWKSFHPPEVTDDPLKRVKERVSLRAAATFIEPVTTATNDDAANALLEDVITHLKVKVRAIRNANRAAFPPLAVTREKDPVIRVEFDTSVPHGLIGTIKLWFAVEVLDAAAGVIRMSAAGLWTCLDTNCPKEWHIVHLGLTGVDEFSGSLESCMYWALDRAQQAAAENEEMHIDFGPIAGGKS